MRNGADGRSRQSKWRDYQTIGSFRAMIATRFSRHNWQLLADNQYRLHRRPIITPTAAILGEEGYMAFLSFVVCEIRAIATITF